MGVLECSLANSIIPSLVIPFVLLFIPEYHKWNEQLTGRSAYATAVVLLLCASITIFKHADRLCKFSIVSQASTMFFAAIDANMKVVAGVGTFLFFGEDAKWCQIVGFILVFFALFLMVADKRNKHLKSLNQGGFTKTERISLCSNSRHDKRDRKSSVGSEEHLLEDGDASSTSDEYISDSSYVDEDGYDLRLSITSA